MHSSQSLEHNYITYINAINAKDWPAVASFAAPLVTHNNHSYSNTEYADMIKVTSSPFIDVTFHPERIIVDEKKEELACRIRFEWPGKEPFWEHVFYKLEDGKISQVWSMVNSSTLE